ncbi:MAG: hypothetical protein Q7J54_06045 [Candidatus Woesearchaeota archaeon]|nr:hypothetical protein [Candidatus Woesearchaeota archaeon]
MDYFDLKFKESGNIESLFSDCFGRACRLLGFNLNEEYNSHREDKGNFMKFEDDAVIYIIKLCSSFVNPSARARFSRYVNDKQEIINIVEKKDSRLKFIFYKTNADFLLLSFGIVSDDQINHESSIEMGKYCYRFASAYRQELRFGDDDLGSVLMKMAANFEKYADILACMKRNQFSPYKMYNDDEFSALVDKIH